MALRVPKRLSTTDGLQGLGVQGFRELGHAECRLLRVHAVISWVGGCC